MSQESTCLEVYLETGAKRTFAAALDWPGWCRQGRDEASALLSLLAYGPRYARILRYVRTAHTTELGFRAPIDIAAFTVVERLPGNATTDFGAPDAAPGRDAQPLDDLELQRLHAILQAGWQAFDATVEMAQGKPLRTGPRGGGRTLEGILQHVLGAELGYLSKLGGKYSAPDKAAPDKAAPGKAAPNQAPSPEPLRQAILQTLAASAHGEIAPFGPRGGKRWTPQYFVRREAWHVLDHVWEIEDRLVGTEVAS
jgi:hypothetical protein